MKIPILHRLLGRGLEDEVLKLRREVYALKQRGERPRGITSHEPLLAIARALRDAKSLESFADVAVAAVIAALGAERGALILDRKGELVLIAARDAKKALDTGSFAWSRTIASVAVCESQVVATGRAAEDERFSAHASVARHGIESVLALPLPTGAAPGCLYLEASQTGFAALEPATLLAIVDLIAVAIARLADESEMARRTKLQALGLAAAAILHDLRSPLASIGYAIALVQPEAEEERRALSLARSACARALELSEGLVALATGRERKLEPRSVRIAELLEEHIGRVGGELRSSSIEVVREFDRDAIALVDRSALLRIVENLTRNAHRAMSDGGRLVVRCARIARGVTIEIGDSGTGMSAEQIASVQHLTAGTEPGGLGLILVRDLAETMGGEIRIESGRGRGTRVTVILPGAQ